MMCQSLSIMVYSLFMLQIFYRLPVKYKIVAFSKRGMKKINTQESKLIVNSDMTKQDQNLYDFMQMDQEGRDFEDEQTKKGRISLMNTSND